MPTRAIKTLAAIALVASLALPQSTCARYRAPDGRVVDVVPRDAIPGAYQRFTERHYALDDFQSRELGSWLWLGLFIWPLPLLALALRRPSSRLTRTLWYAEPLLAITSAYCIRALILFSAPAVGAYVAVSANGLYLVAWILEGVERFRRWRTPAGA